MVTIDKRYDLHSQLGGMLVAISGVAVYSGGMRDKLLDTVAFVLVSPALLFFWVVTLVIGRGDPHRDEKNRADAETYH